MKINDDYPHEQLLQVVRAYYCHSFIIEIEFNNGEIHQIDFQPIIFGKNKNSYKYLQNLDLFKNFKMDYTIYWLKFEKYNDEIAFMPEYLYFLAHQYDETKQEMFKSWGYL